MSSTFKVTPEKSFARWLIVFCILWTAWHIWHNHNSKTLVVATVSAVAIGVAVRKPAWLYSVNFLWSGLGYLMSLIMVPIITSILYYLIVTPIAVVFRWRGYDPLSVKREPDATTYWQPYKHSRSMKSPF